MEIKSIVKDICENTKEKRVEYIINFLRENNITHKIQKYTDGINIEIVKKGKNTNKEVIFFAHHDIYDKSIEGANDNSSSVAILLSIAKFLYFYIPYYTINIVFNDNEELIGSIFSLKNSKEKKEAIIKKIGSFQYLNKKIVLKKFYIAFVLELSGIGDSLYFSSKSGNIECDIKLNQFLNTIAKNLNINHLNIPISLSDIIAINYFGIKGTVFGSIPYIEGKNYLSDLNKKGFCKEIYPHVWKKNHTSLIELIKNLEKIDSKYSN